MSAAPGPLRGDLLRGVGVVMAGVGGARPMPSRPAGTVNGVCAQLGATVTGFECGGDEAAVAAAFDIAHGALTPEHADVLVLDAAALFGCPAGAVGAQATSGLAALRACVDATWMAVRTVAASALLPAGRPARVITVAPEPGDAYRAGAVAALENMSRTLSIEWARYAITAVTIAPARASDPQHVAALVAFLASRAGAYHSGAILRLAGSQARPPG